jgi:hypothetical protein
MYGMGRIGKKELVCMSLRRDLQFYVYIFVEANELQP